MPKVNEFFHLNIKKLERSETITLGTLGILAHFSHFFVFVLNFTTTIVGSDNDRNAGREELLPKIVAPGMSKKSTLG